MTLVQTEPKKIYIWVDEGWSPGANTLAYYPFTDDYNDHSGNGYNVTNSYSTSLTTVSGVKCLDLNSSYCEINVSNTPLLMNNTLPYTIVFWTLGKNANWNRTFAINWNEGGSWGGSGITAPTSNNGNIECRNGYYGGGGGESEHIKKWSPSSMSATGDSNKWHCFVVSYTTSGLRVYYDGNHISAADTTWTHGPDGNGSPLKIGRRQDTTACGNGYISSLVIENKAWSEQDAVDFYNATKSDYGIS